jgi:hypothetical protein
MFQTTPDPHDSQIAEVLESITPKATAERLDARLAELNTHHTREMKRLERAAQAVSKRLLPNSDTSTE